MNLAQLRHLTDLLTGLETGAWLNTQLQREEESGLRILILLSAPEEAMLGTAPADLQLACTWTVWKNTVPPAETGLVHVDLILWSMTALHMFPAAYQQVFVQARRESTPIWAIISGLERMPRAEQQSFLHSDIPREQARLPQDSLILPLPKAQRLDFARTLCTLLQEHGADLARQGRMRRLTKLRREARKHLGEEYQGLSNTLTRFTHAANIAESGLQSLTLLSRATANNLLQGKQHLPELLTMLQRKLDEIIDREADTLDVEDVIKSIQMRLDEWKISSLNREMACIDSIVQKQINNWCIEYNKDIERFLSDSQPFFADPDAFAGIGIDPQQINNDVQDILLAIQAEILKDFDFFKELLRQSLASDARWFKAFKEKAQAPANIDTVQIVDSPPFLKHLEEKNQQKLLIARREAPTANDQQGQTPQPPTANDQQGQAPQPPTANDQQGQAPQPPAANDQQGQTPQPPAANDQQGQTPQPPAANDQQGQTPQPPAANDQQGQAPQPPAANDQQGQAPQPPAANDQQGQTPQPPAANDQQGQAPQPPAANDQQGQAPQPPAANDQQGQAPQPPAANDQQGQTPQPPAANDQQGQAKHARTGLEQAMNKAFLWASEAVIGRLNEAIAYPPYKHLQERLKSSVESRILEFSQRCEEALQVQDKRLATLLMQSIEAQEKAFVARAAPLTKHLQAQIEQIREAEKLLENQ